MWLIGTTFVSAPPQIARSALPRWIVRNASPIARCELASAQVIVFDGPLSSWMIVTWHASMFGRYFSSQSGVSWLMPSRPQRWRSSLFGLSPARATLRAAVNSLRSTLISPAPMLQPKRWELMVGGSA